jgi:Carboxypeptidase regulatory-like domain
MRMSSSFYNKLTRLVLPIFAALFFLSCQKEVDYVSVDTQGPDLVTKVTSSVSGFVTDENNLAVEGAAVVVGISNTTTDKYGYFEVKNVQVVKNAALVTVSKPGYFKGIKTYIAENNKAAFFRIKLLPLNNAGTIVSSTGGSVTLPNGMIVSLPANAVMIASGSAPYNGTVNVSMQWINPTASDLDQIMPGDLRGINTEGALKRLTSFGMVAVELRGSGGELLQIATGKKATLTFPIPAAIAGNAAASIPLWSFNESNGLWKEEGSATKTGNTYVGEVSHFSFWNCDVPNNYVQFSCTIKDQDGTPIPYATVKISLVSNPYNAGYGYTDSSGYVHGAIPDNAQLLLEVFSAYNCGTPVYSQNFTTTNVNVALGDITINTLGQQR